ncbi:MAG: M48 family metalloprotease [Candidatus Babeliales bacterium]|jgi:hypothetical protein
MNSIKLCAYLAIFSAFGQTSCMGYVKDYYHWQFSTTFGFKEISGKHYPKTVDFLEKLRTKYPKALNGISIVISQYPGPVSSTKSIAFPITWIDELEKELLQTQLVTEWIILHEAGHIYHSHIVKSYTTQWAATAVALASYIAISKNDPEFSTTTMQKVGLYFANNITCMIGHLMYSRYIMEPQADDFANELCENPEAFIETVKWFEKIAFDGMTHPSCASRIAKMEQTLLDKFGIATVA